MLSLRPKYFWLMCKKSLPQLFFNFLICFLLASTAFAQNDYWRAVYLDCQNRPGVSQNIHEKISNYRIISDIRSRDMAQYLTFLYAYMPQSDLADYDFEFCEDQVKVALEARETFSWGKTIPDDIFRHFVVVYRVNNENLDTARSYIFHQLKDRIKNMSMYDAALEVNHWCHEYVDYQPADVRTSAPLATSKTSHGRCGAGRGEDRGQVARHRPAAARLRDQGTFARVRHRRARRDGRLPRRLRTARRRLRPAGGGAEPRRRNRRLPPGSIRGAVPPAPGSPRSASVP